MTATKHITIFDIFGENRNMTNIELLKAGDEMDLTEINIMLLTHHAVANGFLFETETGYSLDDPHFKFALLEE